MGKRNMIDRRLFMKLAAIQTASIAAGCTAIGDKTQTKRSVSGQKPNVVVIVSDDHRGDLMSCVGNKYIKTPNLDRLAAEGILFENAFACSGVCSPSRASILTGKYSHQAAAPRIVWTNNSFRIQERPFPARLHDIGYHAAHFGKWHLGAGDKPMDGYDRWAGFEWLGEYFDTKITINGVEKKFEGFSDDIISNLAAEYITDKAQSNQPFCAFVALKAPHLHFKYPPRLEHAFDGIDIPKPDSYNEDYNETGRLDYLKNAISIEKFVGGLPLFDNSWEKYIKSYYRSALSIDDSVGSILKALDQAGIADNTIVIYTSDQGYTLGEHGLTEKHYAHEEAMRVPMIIRYPKMIKQAVRRKEMVLTIDIAPTMMDICSGSVPKDMVGKSWKPIMLSGKKKYGHWREDFFFETMSPGNAIPGPVAVRTDRYKLITYPWINKEHVELFDLKEDPREMKNLWKDPAYQGVLKDMYQRLERLKKENDWTKVVQIPLDHAWVMGPVTAQHLEAVRQAAITDKMQTPEKTRIEIDGSHYSWQQVKSVNGKLDLKSAIGQGKKGAVFVAIPIEQLSQTDPYLLASIRPVIRMKGYSNGVMCHDTPGGPGAVPSLMSAYNPPLNPGLNVFVLEFAARDDLGLVFWAPDGKIELSK